MSTPDSSTSAGPVPAQRVRSFARFADRRVPERPAGVSRRAVLGSAVGAGVALGVGCPFAAPASAASSAVRARHATALRGIDTARDARALQGRFGFLFPGLAPSAPSDDALTGLGRAMTDLRVPGTDPSVRDGLDNDGIPSGYTFFGQFVDHDLTSDQTPLTEQQQDPTATKNFDSPWLDLRSVYGRGPARDPQLYDPTVHGKLLVGHHDGIDDLPRTASGQAIIGDARNDENLLVAQVHLLFIKLHNRFLAKTGDFDKARQLTRWHYQHLVVNDFLVRFVGRDTVAACLGRNAKGRLVFRGTFYKPKNKSRPMIPVEYSGAAYRFGHSIIRPEYEVSQGNIRRIFGSPQDDLSGGRPLPPAAEVDWNYFFRIPGVQRPDDRNMTRRIDTLLAMPLHDLPGQAAGLTDLAVRNLLRGKRYGMASGQAVATAMGLAPLSDAELGLGPEFAGNAPLWFYVLREAELRGRGRRLGPVGGRIVAETFLGLMALDSTSYFQVPWFKPVKKGWGMGRLVRYVGARYDLVADVEAPPTPETPEDQALELPETDLQGDEAPETEPVDQEVPIP
ncbi:heme peroxidase family protein [Kineococcus gynurae]|uniref:Heme peroxidase family protein n=1 Tax=Kineococcus gynurae TaxID=452979 RepID=A0ABV5LWT0_9ACTN